MGSRPNLAPPPPSQAPRPLAERPVRALLAMALSAALTACSTLPEPRLDPDGSETAHSVAEMAPGWWHVLVRVNYFSSAEAAERLLRERVANLCPDGDLVLENLQIVGNPRLATADAHCAGAPPETPAAPLPDATAGAAEGDPTPPVP